MKLNLSLIITVIIISLFGLLMIYSSSYVWAEYKFSDPFKYVKSQSLFLIIGIILMFLVSKIPFENYYKYSNIIFIVCFILLILVFYETSYDYFY